MWPRKLNAVIQGDSDAIYLIVVSDSATTKDPTETHFVNVAVWHYCFFFLFRCTDACFSLPSQRFYPVYDTDNYRIGLAKTPFTDAKTNQMWGGRTYNMAS